MEIIKNLIQNGTRIGVVVKDGEETYPIPLDGLKSEVCYNDLKASGYALTDANMPEYVKDGEAISTLPTEEWNPTDNETMIFFNYAAMYPPMAMKDLYARLETKATAIKMREGNYTINTREEFEQYLDSIAAGVSDADFMPVNSFVAPKARYTVEEAFNNPGKMSILEKRRSYSGPRFEKFKDFVCKEKKVSDITPTALIDAYMEWGFDGVQGAIIDKSTETTMTNPFVRVRSIDPNAPEVYRGYRQMVKALGQFTNREVVLVGANRDDVEGTLFAGDIEGTLPMLPVSDTYRRNPAFIRDLDTIAEDHAKLSSGEYKIEPLLIPCNQTVRTWMLDNGDRLIYTDDHMGIIRNSSADVTIKKWNGFGRRNDAVFGTNLPTSLWHSENAKVTQEIGELREIANELFKRVELPCTETTFSILMDLGLTPGAALTYVAKTGGFLNELKLCGDDSDEGKNSVPIASPDVDLYLADSDIMAFFKHPNDPNVLTHYFYDSTPDAFYDGNLELSKALEMQARNPERFGVITAERKIEIIHDIVDGNLDVGDISEGRRIDVNMSPNSIYDNLYAAHFILGASISSIREACNNIQIDENLLYSTSKIEVPIYCGERCVIMDLEFRNNAARYARALKGNLMADRVTKAPTFFNVLEVAREMHNGSKNNDPIPRRHVGITGWCISTYQDVVKPDGRSAKRVANEPVVNLLNRMIEEAYTFEASTRPGGIKQNERVSAHVKAAIAAKTAMLDIAAYDEVRFAKKGSYPSEWDNLSAEDKNVIHSNASMYFDSTLAICDDYMDNLPDPQTGVLSMQWTYYCVNARITPTLVIPESSYMIPETELRAVFNSDFVTKNFEQLRDRKHLLSTNTYFSPSRAWDNADFADGHICHNAHYYVVGSGMEAEAKYYLDNSIYMELGSCDADDIAEEVAEQSRSSARQEKIAAWSLARYYAEANAMLKVAKENDKFFSLPTHPAEMLYGPLYQSPMNFVRKLEEGDKLYFPMEDGAVVVGPSVHVTEDTMYGRTVRQPRSKSPVQLTTSETKSSIRSIDGFSSEDIKIVPDLVDRDFSNGKHFTVVDDKLSIDGKPISLEDAIALEELTYAIVHITGRTAIIADTRNVLYRINI